MRVLASSAGMLAELDSTLQRKFSITPATASFLKMFRQQIRLVEPQALEKPACRDRDEDLVLATAVAARAAFIVTGDEDLLVLGAYAGIEIVSPRQFLEQLDSRS